jgi:membrane protease subunit HflK
MSWNEDGPFGGKPPDPAEVLEQFKQRFSGTNLPGGLIGALLVIGALVWAGFGGFYIVNPDEVGVVMRFGKYAYTTDPGPHWHIPYPVETVLKPEVTQVRRVEVGFRTISIGPPARYQKVPQESHMLTKDENIVSCEFIVQYRVKDAMAFLFNVIDPEKAVRDAGEASMREVVGRSSIDDVLTENKDRIQVEATELLLAILDSYDAGVQVDYVKLQDVYPPDPVIDAFRDVASAREDRERLKNEAEAYHNDVVPRAQGEREKMLREAEGYRETKIKSAQGDVARFQALLTEYLRAKEVTRQRLYLEAMEDVLAKAKIVLSETGGVLPVLPLDVMGGKGGAQR